MNTVKNKHYEKTHDQIINCFIELIITNKKKISVKDICSYCNINRSTFYMHFSDIDVLMDTVLANMFGSFANDMTTLSIPAGNHPVSKEFILSVVNIIFENRMVFSYCVRNTNYLHMQKNTDYLIREIFLPRINSYMNIPEEDLHFYYAFISSGFISVITRWIDDGCSQSTEYVSNILFNALPQL
jgi:AcrR family transcriptional regulator